MATVLIRALMVEPCRPLALAQNGSRPQDSRDFAAIQNHRGALCRRQVVAGLDLGQTGGKVSQPRLAEDDNGVLDESAAHGRRVAPAVPGVSRGMSSPALSGCLMVADDRSGDCCSNLPRL